MSKIIEVRPIQRDKWHGLPPEKDFARPFVLEALLDSRTHKYATGLNDTYDEKGNVVPNPDRIRLEKATGYNLSDSFSTTEPHPFWSNQVSRVKLENRTNLFNLENPLEEIKYHMMKASRFIANSQLEYQEGKFPDAKFILYNEQEEVEAKAKQVEIKDKVNKLIQDLDTKQKSNIIQIVEGRDISKQGVSYITVEFDNVITKLGYSKMLALLTKDKTRISVHATIVSAVDKRILRKQGDLYFYFEEPLGDIESAINFFLDPKNQLIKMQILEKLNSL